MSRFSARSLLTLLLALMLSGFGLADAEAAASVAIVLSERSRAQLEMVDILRKALEHGPAAETGVVVLGWHQLGQLPRDGGLIVAVGSRATTALASIAAPAPVLATLLPRASFEQAVATRHGTRPFSAIYLDQPPDRQLNLLRLALPDRRRIAVLTGPGSRALAAPLAVAAHERGQTLLNQYVTGEALLYTALLRGLVNADLLLALPDPSIYNAHTFSHILLTAYRYKVPVIGYSPASVRAGALMAMYSSTAQIGAQAADIARDVLAGRPLPPPGYPKEYSITINTYVAQSLNLRLEAESSLLGHLRQEDRHP